MAASANIINATFDPEFVYTFAFKNMNDATAWDIT
jgi:hypothetical protein